MTDSDPDFQNMVMRTTEAVYGTLYDRYINLNVKTPKQRYDELVNRHPGLFDLFSLKDIASFLNITPTYLSRLRNSKAFASGPMAHGGKVVVRSLKKTHRKNIGE